MKTSLDDGEDNGEAARSYALQLDLRVSEGGMILGWGGRIRRGSDVGGGSGLVCIGPV